MTNETELREITQQQVGMSIKKTALEAIREALVFECTTATDGNYLESMVLVRSVDMNKVTDAIHDLDEIISAMPERESVSSKLKAAEDLLAEMAEALENVWYSEFGNSETCLEGGWIKEALTKYEEYKKGKV